MFGAERLLADRQRPLVERPRAGEVALGLKQDGEVVEARGGVGMLGSERLLADRQRSLVERPRAGEVALVLKQEGEVVEARGGVGMVGPERLLPDRQRPLEERPRPGEVALGLKQISEVVEARGGRRDGRVRAPSRRSSAPARRAAARRRGRPGPEADAARLLRLVAVSGCSGPSAFSRIASARSKSGRAPARSPWA